jgi:sec-independent protein translocase protein TatC
MNDKPEKLAEGTLISHLLELRNRLVRAFALVFILVLPAAYFRNEIFDLVAKPLILQLPKGSTMITTGVMTPFTTPFKLSI